MIKIGERIDERYRITGRIGSGGMAEVFEATDFVAHKIVAIKVMKEELLGDAANIKRFEMEANACAAMNHPNIIRVFSRGVIEDRPYMAYEYIKGQTLSEKLDFSAQFTVHEACNVILQLLDAVKYIHEHGIIHRDIKPENLFYLPNGTVKLADFGIAVDANMNETKTEKGILGSVFYLAPEVISENNVSIQSDIYSVGVTLFQLVTGRLPFEEGHAYDIAIQHVKKPFPPASKFSPNIPKELDKIILKACKKKPIERYQNAQEMIDALKTAMENKNNFKEKKSFLRRLFGFK